MKMLCDTNQEYVLGNITESCSPDSVEPAYNYYSKNCLDKASITVAALPDGTSDNSSGSNSTESGPSGSGSGTGTDSVEGSSSGNNQSAASRMHMAATGLLVTGLTGLLFL